MIQKTLSYKVQLDTGEKFFGTLEEAQKAELGALTNGDKTLMEDGCFADFVMANREAIIDILTTTPNSKPSARKINGGTKKRKAVGMAAINAATQDSKQ